MAAACTASLGERIATACMGTTSLVQAEESGGSDKLPLRGSSCCCSATGRRAGHVVLQPISHSLRGREVRLSALVARSKKIAAAGKHVTGCVSTRATAASQKGEVGSASATTVKAPSSAMEEAEEQERVFNFAAGPATLPLNVLKKAQAELVNWQGSGMSVMEMSHRGKDFLAIIQKAESNLRQLMRIPEDYYVLFLQGGATQQFSAVPLNLCSSPDDIVDHVITGSWSSKAYEESTKYCKANVAANAKPTKYTVVPPRSEWQLTPGARYVHLCANETIHGVEFKEFPDVGDAILVADMSSNFCSKPVDVSRFGVIYAGAQKNVGPSGVTIVIVRKDLVGHARPETPIMLDWKTQADNASLYNTPPCYAIYMCGLVFEDLLVQGGLEAVEQKNKEKASLLYHAIEKSNGFYRCPVDKSVQSLMNVPFTLADPELEAQFLKEATAQGLVQLKGHRSVGGVRASIYNAMPKAGVEKLVGLMIAFQAKHSLS